MIPRSSVWFYFSPWSCVHDPAHRYIPHQTAIAFGWSIRRLTAGHWTSSRIRCSAAIHAGVIYPSHKNYSQQEKLNWQKTVNAVRTHRRSGSARFGNIDNWIRLLLLAVCLLYLFTSTILYLRIAIWQCSLFAQLIVAHVPIYIGIISRNESGCIVLSYALDDEHRIVNPVRDYIYIADWYINIVGMRGGLEH